MGKHFRKVWNRTYKNFLQVPNWEKSEQYTKWKGRISASDNPDKIYNFYTDTYFYDEARYVWCDFFFLSRLHKFAYYAHIVTCQRHIVDEVSNQVLFSKELEEIKEKYKLYEFKFIKHYNENGRKYYTMDNTEENKIRPELGDMSYWQYYDSKVDEALSKKPIVYEEYKVEPEAGFHGLNSIKMIVDEEFITPETIAKHINNFYKLGEKSWKFNTPVNPDSIIWKHDWMKDKKASMGNALKSFMGLKF